MKYSVTQNSVQTKRKASFHCINKATHCKCVMADSNTTGICDRIVIRKNSRFDENNNIIQHSQKIIHHETCDTLYGLGFTSPI